MTSTWVVLFWCGEKSFEFLEKLVKLLIRAKFKEALHLLLDLLLSVKLYDFSHNI